MSLSGSNETASGSLEVSIPTDLTITVSEGDIDENAGVNIGFPKRSIKELYSLKLEKQQLQKVIEKLKLEIQSRDSKILAKKSQFELLLNQKEIYLEKTLAQKQTKICRLEADVLSLNEELRILKNKASNELAHLLKKCQEFKENQNKLVFKQEEIKSSLVNLEISEIHYDRLKTRNAQSLSLQEFTAIRVHDVVLPLKQKIRELTSHNSSLETTLRSQEKELDQRKRREVQLERELEDCRANATSLSLRLEEVRKDVKVDDFRVYNFDRIKRERDQYELENEELSKQSQDLQFNFTLVKNERNILEERLSETKNKLRQCEQDLSRYQNECFDNRTKLERNKDDCLKSFSQLKSERERSEEMREKFLKCRSELIAATEELRDNQNQVKLLKENVSLVLKSESELKGKLNELTKEYDKILYDFESFKTKCTRESDLTKEELSEMRSSYNAVSKNYANLQETLSKLQRESQGNNYLNMEVAMRRQDDQLHLQNQVKDLKKQLDNYKSLENEYSSTLRVYAAASFEARDRVQIPASSLVKGRLSEDTITLTKRILSLERQNAEAFSTIQRLTKALNSIRAHLASSKQALNCAGKPTSHLVLKISSQEEQILSLETAIRASEEAKDCLENEVSELRRKLQSVEFELRKSISWKRDFNILQSSVKEMKSSLGDNRIPAVNNQLPSAIRISKGNNSILECCSCLDRHSRNCISI